MLLAGFLDVALILLFIGYLAYGYGAGFLRSAGPMLGALIGALASFFVTPLINATVVEPMLRLVVLIVASILLIAIGQAVGAWLTGVNTRRRERRSPGTVDRVFGAITNVVVAALIAWILGFSVGSIGVPALTQAIASSGVLNTVDTLTPEPVKRGLSQLRAIAVNQGVPRVIDALGSPSQQPPEIRLDSPQLQDAADSVVRITGTAWECGQGQSGSGFVVSDDRVITNAHVVAGVSEPVIEATGEPARSGRVVYFDPDSDLAVIEVPGLDADPIPLSDDLDEGDGAVFQGFPLGGPFTSEPALVQDIANVRTPDIYGRGPTSLEVFVLTGNVQSGNSGGPLLTLDGDVAGVIFARSENLQNVGYALTMEQLGPVAAQAPSLDRAVSTGACVPG